MIFYFLIIGIVLMFINPILTLLLSEKLALYFLNNKYYFFPNAIYKNTNLNRLGSYFLSILLFIGNYLYTISTLICYFLSKDCFSKKDNNYIIFIHIKTECSYYNIINLFIKECIKNNCLILKTNNKYDRNFIFKIKTQSLELVYEIINKLSENKKYNDLIIIKKIRKGKYI